MAIAFRAEHHLEDTCSPALMIQRPVGWRRQAGGRRRAPFSTISEFLNVVKTRPDSTFNRSPSFFSCFCLVLRFMVSRRERQRELVGDREKGGVGKAFRSVGRSGSLFGCDSQQGIFLTKPFFLPNTTAIFLIDSIVPWVGLFPSSFHLPVPTTISLVISCFDRRPRDPVIERMRSRVGYINGIIRYGPSYHPRIFAPRDTLPNRMETNGTLEREPRRRRMRRTFS